LNKLCNQDFPAGYNVHTEGLSIKYAEKENVVTYLDSAGFE